jgi:hypothetical protein
VSCLLSFTKSIPSLEVQENDLVIGNFNNGLFARSLLKELTEENEQDSTILIPVHISADGIGMYKHGKDGAVSMMPLYIAPIFAENSIRNDHIDVMAFIPGPQQENVDMFSELIYEEMAELSNGFIAKVGDDERHCRLVFVMGSMDYRGLPEWHRHKQVPSDLACHVCHFEANEPLDRPIPRKRNGEEKEIKQGLINYLYYFDYRQASILR